MELYERILCETIARDVIPSLQLDSAKLLELKCYQAIEKTLKQMQEAFREEKDMRSLIQIKGMGCSGCGGCL